MVDDLSEFFGTTERAGSSGGTTSNVNVTTTEQLILLNKQIIAAFAIIIALMISIITINGYKKLLTITDQEEIGKLLERLVELPKISIMIILITSYFYMYNSINDFQKSTTQENARYIVANVLAVISTIIRFWNIIPLTVEDFKNQDEDDESDDEEDTQP